jgi:hypothetical protein
MDAGCPSPRRVQKGHGFWPAGGTEPVKVKRTYAASNANRSSHQHIIAPGPLDGPRHDVSIASPFGTDVDHASDTAGSGGRLKLLVDGGARCVEVRAKSSAGSGTHDPPIAQRNVLTGQGDIATHFASAHMSSALSGGVHTSDISLRKHSPGQGAQKHLYTPRNVITGHGICDIDLHMASSHVAGIGSDSHEATRGGLRRRTSREFQGAAPDSPNRNILLGHGVETHHQSAHLVASASSARVYRETPKTRRDPMRSSASDLLHYDEDARPAPIERRPSSSQMYGGERPF